MNFKKTFILAAILCFLLLLFYLIESPLKNAKKLEQLLLLSGFDPGKAGAIFIKSPEKGEFYLKKKPEGGWIVESGKKSYQADSASIDSLLETVGRMKIESIASKNPAKYKALEVDKEKGLEVRINDLSQKNLAHFYVGKSGPDLFSTYVRMENASQAVLCSGMLKTVFDRDLKEWRNKTIFSLNPQGITEYQVKGAKQLQLKKLQGDAWEVVAPEKFPANKETADDCIKTFCTLKAADFAEGPLKDFQLDPPQQEIAVVLKGGATKSLLVGKEKNAYQRYVKTSDADTIYVLENYNLEKLIPSLDKFEPADKEKEKDKQKGTPSSSPVQKPANK